MKRIGRRFLAVFTVGCTASVAAGIAAMSGSNRVFGVCLAIAMGAVIGAITLLRIEVPRQVIKAFDEQGARVDALPKSDDVATLGLDGLAGTHFEQISRALIKDAVEESEQRIAKLAVRSVAEMSALMQMLDWYRPSVVMHADDKGVQPSAVASVVELIQNARPRRTLVIDGGSAVLWWGRAVAEYGGEVAHVVASDERQRRQSEVERHGLTSTLSVESVPEVVPDAPHAFLPWYDLSVLDQEECDLIIVGLPEPERALVPVLSLIVSRLGRDGMLALLSPRGHDSVRAAWEADPLVTLDMNLSSDRVGVFRRQIPIRAGT